VSKVVKKAIVSGRVQGVFYRASTRQKATSLRVLGHAINLADGNVEVVAYGEERNVQSLIDWLWTGSVASKVRNVSVVEELDGIDTNGMHSFVTG